MKKVLIQFFAIASIFVIGCNSNADNKQEKDCCAGVYAPTTVLDSAESLIDKEIRIKANVSRVCHCSGKEMFLTDMKDTTVTLRVQAAGEIDKFNECLIGKHVNITGFLRVNKITKTDMEKKETDMVKKIAETKEKALSDASLQKKCEMLDKKLEHLKTTKAEQLKWMADHNLDFFPDYFFEPQKFADCCKTKNDPDAAQTTESCKEVESCEK